MNTYYWIEDLNADCGPEIARLSIDLFFTTRCDIYGEVHTVTNAPKYVKILAGPLPQPTPE
jgi:hypothetical protein